MNYTLIQKEDIKVVDFCLNFFNVYRPLAGLVLLIFFEPQHIPWESFENHGYSPPS